jgi:Putative peptidoglycan binding domain
MKNINLAPVRKVVGMYGILFTLSIITLVAAPLAAHAALLTQQLDFGMTNNDVRSLQTFLAEDVTIYPQGLVTGYFGFLTKAAVSNFQSRNGIESIGRVGPITLLAINNQMNSVGSTVEGAGKVTHIGILQPTLSNVQITPTATGANISWNSSIAAVARVMYSTSWPFNYNTAPSVTNTTAVSMAQNVAIGNLQSNTVYYYVLESLDPQGNFSWSDNGQWFKTL